MYLFRHATLLQLAFITLFDCSPRLLRTRHCANRESRSLCLFLLDSTKNASSRRGIMRPPIAAAKSFYPWLPSRTLLPKMRMLPTTKMHCFVGIFFLSGFAGLAYQAIWAK